MEYVETLGDGLNKPRQHSFIFKLSLGNKLTYTQTHNKGLQMKATLFTAFVLTHLIYTPHLFTKLSKVTCIQ